LAAASNYLDIVKLLIEKGADIKSSKALVLASPEVKEYLQSL
jgi:ankyrin repeat protein